MKPLIVGTCYVADEATREIVIAWSLLNRKLNPGIDILLVDSASPFDPNHFLPRKAPRHANIIVRRFPDNIGHLSKGGGDGWGRAFCHGLETAMMLGYSHIAYIDADLLFARPVMPVLEKLQRCGVGVACPFDTTYQFVENGLVFADLWALIQAGFIEKYDWPNSPPPTSPEALPERRFEMILHDVLFTLPLRGLRNDGGVLTRENIGQFPYPLDYLTHCADFGLYDRFLQMRGIAL